MQLISYSKYVGSKHIIHEINSFQAKGLKEALIHSKFIKLLVKAEETKVKVAQQPQS